MMKTRRPARSTPPTPRPCGNVSASGYSTPRRPSYDQTWLDYQYEIGLRHHRTKKNQTDNGHTLGHIRARDLLAFCASIVVPMKPYLAKKGHPPEVVNRMYDAWWKSMILQATLWVQPYIREGDF